MLRNSIILTSPPQLQRYLSFCQIILPWSILTTLDWLFQKRKQTLSDRVIFGIILSYATITKDILAEHILFLSNNARVCHIFLQQKSKIILSWPWSWRVFSIIYFLEIVAQVWDLDSFLFQATIIFICTRFENQKNV